jgi:hypothetical protein
MLARLAAIALAAFAIGSLARLMVLTVFGW